MHSFHIDYEQIFDAVDSWAVMKMLRREKVEEIYVKILEDIYAETTATIKLHKISDKILIIK